MSKKLKPCPFCGGEATAHRGMENGKPTNRYFGVTCRKCDFSIWKNRDGKCGADKAWNTRNHDKLIEQIEGKKKPVCTKDTMRVGRNKALYNQALDDVIKLIRGE